MGVRRALVDVTPLRLAPAYRRLLIGQALSGFGSQLAGVAVLFQLWQLTSSTVWTGSVGIAQAVPLVAAGLFVGSIIDRTDRRRFYLRTTVGMATCSVLFAIQGFCEHLPPLGLLLLIAVQSGFGAGSGPAVRTFISRLLPRDQVAAGLSLQRIAFQGSMLAGPALGGVIIGWVGVGTCYLIDAVTFAAACYAALRLPPMRPDGEPSRGGLRALADGMRFIAHNPPVRGVLLLDVSATVLAMPISLFPLINAQRFGNDPRTFGLFLTAIAVGGVLASVFSGTFTHRTRTGLVMICGSATWGTAAGLFGLCANPWIGLGFLVIAGAADTVAMVSSGTIVQLSTPDAMRGRVAIAEQLINQAGPNLGNLRGGLVAGATSGMTALVSGGLLCVLTVAGVATSTPGLRGYSTR